MNELEEMERAKRIEDAAVERWRLSIEANPELGDRVGELRLPYVPHSPSPKQHAALLLNHVFEIFYGGAAGGGKALALDTPLPTPTGWTTMGEVQKGDWLLGENGQAVKVLATSGIMHNRPCYRMAFSTGEAIVADAEHVWRVCSFDGVNDGNCLGVLCTTEELAHRILTGPITVANTRAICVLGMEYVASVPVQCVTVANADGMFLAGRTCIPTHNSDFLLMAALQYAHVPGYRAIIMRRTLADLKLSGGLIERSRDWLGRYNVRYNGSEHRWSFSSGASLEFGYMRRENDKYRYKSSEFQFIGFDEMTQFSESQYTYMFSRIRRTIGMHVPLRVRGASNPGQAGHRWVKKRFVESKNTMRRVFIPARIQDNPGMDAEEYITKLDQMDPLERSRLKEGNWDATSGGGILKRWWFKAFTGQLPSKLELIRFWDLAGTEPTPGNKNPDWSCGLLLARFNGINIILDVELFQKNPADTEERMVEVSKADDAVFGFRVPIGLEQEPGQSGKSQINHFHTVFPGHVIIAGRPTVSKAVRAAPVASKAKAGKILYIEGEWTEHFLDEIEDFDGSNRRKRSDGQTQYNDDQVDALTGAFGALSELDSEGMPIAFGTFIEADDFADKWGSPAAEPKHLIDVKHSRGNDDDDDGLSLRALEEFDDDDDDGDDGAFILA